MRMISFVILVIMVVLLIISVKSVPFSPYIYGSAIFNATANETFSGTYAQSGNWSQPASGPSITNGKLNWSGGGETRYVHALTTSNMTQNSQNWSIEWDMALMNNSPTLCINKVNNETYAEEFMIQ